MDTLYGETRHGEQGIFRNNVRCREIPKLARKDHAVKMVYVSRDGSVHQGNAPWSLERLVALFWGICNFIYVFFLTMFNMDPDNPRGGFSRGSWGGGGGSGGGGNPPRPPTRRMGGFKTLSDCSVPGGG